MTQLPFQISVWLILLAAILTPGQRATADTNHLAVFTYAGLTGTNGSADGVGTNAGFDFPSSIAMDGAGNIFVADSSNHTIRKIGPAGLVTTIAGLAGHPGTNDGVGAMARFDSPNTVAVDAAGNVYVADSLNNTIRGIKFDGANWMVSTLAGAPGVAGTNDDVGSAARFSNPKAVTVDPTGIVYVADANNDTIRKMVLSGGNWTVSTLAGKAGTTGTANGLGNIARFNSPRYVATDAGGNIYVADWNNFTVRKITPAGNVSTLAGLGGTRGTNDGVGTGARFNSPRGLCVDAATNVYVADFFNSTIRKIAPDGTVTTLAGNVTVLGGANGTGTNALFNEPCVAIADSAGQTFYIADTGNHSIRKAYYDNGKPIISTEPYSQTVLVGSNLTLSVSAAGTAPVGYQWFLNGTNLPGVTNASFTVTNVQLSDAGDYGVTATNGVGATTNPVASVKVVTLLITSQPQSLVVTPGTNISFSVGVAGIGPVSYQWLFNGTNMPGATNATISLTNIPAADAGFYQVVATNIYESVTSSAASLSILGVPPVFDSSHGNFQYTNGQVYLRLSGLTGQGVVVISASSNLVSWVPIYTNASAFGSIPVIDTGASNQPARYYRATAPSAP